ncbi:transposase DNA-binding-containing protein [Geminocystis sp. CENA526]|uniref:transposase DNA-binding-containing protein n=1 Tax=Geminocystis sp. CENA526 TaxID=1355871 RepID=UPI003D6DE65F
MQSWAEQELKDTGLPDKRLNQRLIKIVEQAIQQPSGFHKPVKLGVTPKPLMIFGSPRDLIMLI